MSQMDDLLQDGLSALENGVSLETAMAGLQDERSELEPLLGLASAVGKVEHPQPQLADSLEGHLADLARDSRARQPRRNIPWGRLALVGGVMGAAMLLLITFISFLSLGLWFAGPRSSGVATLMGASGEVFLANEGASGDWEAAGDGEIVRQGQLIRTGSEGSVTLVFYEGTRAILGPESEVTLTTLDGNWRGGLQVQLQQNAGQTVHNVVPLRGGKSAYQVLTPSGEASVLGTVFSVVVDEDGSSRFAVDIGQVLVRADGSEVTLTPGQVTSALAGQLLEDPAYQFTLRGEVNDIAGEVWTVNEVPFTVTAATNVKGVLGIGSFVQVSGHFLEDYSMVADMIKDATGKKVISSFTGVIDDIDDDLWTISGIPIVVNENTHKEGIFSIGDPVEVKFVVMFEGGWLATSIEHLDEEPPEEPQETEEPPEETETITPTVTITPTETVTPTLVTDCVGADPQPKATKLAAEYEVTYEEIMGWFCQKFGFGEIDLAYGLSRLYGIPVEEIFDMRFNGMGWGNIKKALQKAYATTTPEPPGGEPPDPSETPEPPGEASCADAKATAKGEKTARKLGLTLDTVLGWYCLGFPFNDIEKAYRLSWDTGAPVTEVFDLLANGENWGQIKKIIEGEPVVDKPVKTKKPK